VAVEQVEGVQEARFSHPEGTGWVRYDPGGTTPDAFLEHLAAITGFEARVVDRE